VRFERIRLSNFKCYADADLRLEPGVTVIHGLNGSGKSSLLEACFFALYGATALEKTLDEVVTIGAEDAEVELWFAHGGNDYHLERRVRATGERAQTASCTLETPEGAIEGARDVRRHVARLLRMDAEAFVNCAYVRQGEVNKLINATPAQRQDVIDDLLQLGKLEEYRERASEARLGVQDVLSGQRGRLEEMDEQIEKLEDQDLFGRRDDLATERNEVDARIERFEENREQATEALSEAESTLEAHEEKREQLGDVEETIDDLTAKITETERERESLEDELGDHRSEVEALDDRIDDLLAETELDDADAGAVEELRADLLERREEVSEEIQAVVGEMEAFKNEASNLADQADDLEERAEEASEEAEQLDEEADEAEAAVEQARERIESLDERIEEERSAFENAPVDFGEADDLIESLSADLESLRERETDLRADHKEATSRVEEGQTLLAEGKCPECGQDVEGSPHVDSLEEHRERVADIEEQLSDLEAEKESIEDRFDRAETLQDVETTVKELEGKRENAADLLGERESGLAEKRERADSLREKADDLADEAEVIREKAAKKREQATAKQSELGSLNATKGDLRTRIERLEALEDAIEDREDHLAEIDRIREKRADLAEYNDERRENLASARERKRDLEAEFDEERIEEARAEKERAGEYLADVEETLEDLEEQRSDLDADIGAVENAIETLEGLRDGRENLAERVAALETLHEETEDLQAMYGDLRADLRQRNVESLERMLNEVFDLVYGNDSYSRIELSGEYELTVYQKDGNPLEPEQLSGGERALFNLSLRCAIYRLLSEGIEGAAPMPPLILDEPTVFLDSGHVSRLIELVDSMRSLGVEQIVVVSHDEELVGAADQLVTVTKDATTNRSRVETGESSLPGIAD
jgi:exonuclease SbcC